MKNLTTVGSILLCALACGCDMTNSAARATPELNDLGLEYAMPFVSYKIQVELPLERCDIEKKNEAVFGPLAVVAIPEITADRTQYRLRLSALESLRVDHNLTVTKNDNGTVKAINAVADDRTFSIIGNLFKFVAGLFKSAAVSAQWAKDSEVATCNDATLKLFEEAGRHKKSNYEELLRIAETDISKVDPQVFTFHSANVERLIAFRGQRLAAIKETLTPKGECSLAPRRNAEMASCEIKLETRKLIDRENLVLKIAVARSAKPKDMVSDHTKLVIRNVRRETVNISPSTAGDWTVEFEVAQPPILVFPQWGDDIALPLDVGLSEKRTIALTFSPLGDISSVNWATPARLEKATADLAGVAEAAAAAKTGLKHGEDDAEIAELDRKIALLEKRAKLEELKAKAAVSELPTPIPDPSTPVPKP